ncbi:winged helix-turn-helix transcriptional regulator [Pseudovibrio axinellae]|nr:helix-turn-helix domain-containing protein [Pseudovibrio axinellae]
MTKLVRSCSIWRALEIMGDSSAMMILEAAWLGARTFGQFQNATGLRRALLSDRLKRIVEKDVMCKALYSERPARYEYRLTEKGQGLYWMSLMMLRWERIWGDQSQVVKVKLTHKKCGQIFEPLPLCATCGHEYSAFEVDWEEGPGVGTMAANYVRRRQHRDAIAERNSGSAIMVEVAQIMGDRWAVLVLRALFTGLNSFDRIREDSGAATNILTERLNWMQTLGLVNHNDEEAGGKKTGYRLTRKSTDIFPILLMLMRWGDTYYASPEGAPVLLTHEPNGHNLSPVVACSACREELDVHDVTYELEWPDGVEQNFANPIEEA